MERLKQYLHNRPFVILAVILVGIIFRFSLINLPTNYDFESYKIVASLISDGKNFYNETSRYNYSPLWANILFVVNLISTQFNNSEFVFKYLIIGVLNLADIGIFIILLRKFGLKIAAVFYLNPLSLLLTGYHRQFDNLAVFFALFAMLNFEKKIIRSRILSAKSIGIISLTISILVKHIFILFPFWMIFREKNWKDRIILLIPIVIFILSFVPYFDGGTGAIIQNVFQYTPTANYPFLRNFVPPIITNNISHTLFFIAVILIIGYFFRKKNLFDSSLIYTLVIVIFSPGIFINHFAIALAAMARYWNKWFVGVSLVTAYLYLLDINGIGMNIRFLVERSPTFLLTEYNGNFVFDLPHFLLICGFIWIFYGKMITNYINNDLSNLVRKMVKRSNY